MISTPIDFDNIITGSNILITGGTGTLGHQLVKILLNNYNPNKVIIFSRDEFKQNEMSKIYSTSKYPNLIYFIGDIRDYERLHFAFKNVDIVYHAAALKHVPIVEYNPMEAIKTNVLGTENVIKAAINRNVKRVIGISTDKCVNPVNLYGATKLCLEKLMIAGNHLSGGETLFSVVRYGNVFGSRGSVVPLFTEQQKTGKLTITNGKMTRFTLTIDEAVNFTIRSTIDMIGGEIFVPKLLHYNINQLSKIIGEKCEIVEIGLRPGEKMNEIMISDNESHLTIDNNDRYIVLPSLHFKNSNTYYSKYGSNLLKSGYSYTSNDSSQISDEQLRILIKDLQNY